MVWRSLRMSGDTRQIDAELSTRRRSYGGLMSGLVAAFVGLLMERSKRRRCDGTEVG